MLLTNGTDEAIQVLINTYVDDEDEVIILRPSYAMYKFYAEVAGAARSRNRLPRRARWPFRSKNCSKPFSRHARRS